MIKKVQNLNGKVAVISRFISKATDKCIPFFEVIKKEKKNFEWNRKCKDAFQALVDYLERPHPFEVGG